MSFHVQPVVRVTYGMTFRYALPAVLSAELMTPHVSAQFVPVGKKFDVASIKAYKAQDGNFMIRTQPDGTFRAIGVTVKMLVMFAYNLKAFQVSGGPGWMTTDLWEIQAKADDSQGPSRADSQARVRELLMERYHFMAHTERRTMPVYALVATKSAAVKLKPAGGDGGPGICPCGPGSLSPERASMSMLADQLSTRLWHIVLDKTGLKGEYSFKLEWAPQVNEYGPESLGLPPGLGGGRQEGTANQGPSISTALIEQLGLGLKSQRGQVEVIVVDHIEKASEN